MIELVKDKVNTLNDFEESLKFLFSDSILLKSDDINYIASKISVDILKLFLKELDRMDEKIEINLNLIIKNIQSKLMCSPKDIWKTLRLSLTGENHGPSLQQIINIYGLDKTKKLINNYVHR